jgi:hypothetical protein
MELMWIGGLVLLMAIAIVVGLVLMSGSSRFRRHGGDRQQYQRPPYGSSGPK